MLTSRWYGIGAGSDNVRHGQKINDSYLCGDMLLNPSVCLMHQKSGFTKVSPHFPSVVAIAELRKDLIS